MSNQNFISGISVICVGIGHMNGFSDKNVEMLLNMTKEWIYF